MKLFSIICVVFFLFSAEAHAALRVVAAEGVYGQLAKTLGGEQVDVRSILNSPNQDPHLFSATPSIARAVADADIIIYNGLGYDEWMRKLTSSTQDSAHQVVIVVADLVGRTAGENPHLWYDPSVMPVLARTLIAQFKQKDPVNQKVYEQRLQRFEVDYQGFIHHIGVLKQQLKDTPVLATEPLFQYMADALGLQMLGMDLQMSMMNHTAPSPQQLKQFQDIIHQRQVRVMIYNQQVNQPLTTRLKRLAQQADIPMVGMTETQPDGLSYRQWMERQLDALVKALRI